MAKKKTRSSRVRSKSKARSARSLSARAAAATPETLEVSFELLDVVGEPIRDPDALFTFRRLSDNRQIGSQIQRVLNGAPASFRIPVQTGDAVVCEFDLQRYRFAHSPVFIRTPGRPVRLSSTLFREPLEWMPQFTRWASLPPALAGLQDALEASADVLLHKDHRSLGKLVDASYDAMSGADVVLAKTALLNVHHRLRTTTVPASRDRSWFSFVQRIVAIDRERILAFVDPEMETMVRQINEHIGEFRAEYERTNAENHRGNVPATMRERITSMVSIKSTHDKGNFQLTLSHLSGPEEVLLDADIDENGQLLTHLFDLVKHKFTGGTHPHDVHEIFAFQNGLVSLADLGYRLA